MSPPSVHPAGRVAAQALGARVGWFMLERVKMEALPIPIAERVESLCIRNRFPAFVFVRRDGHLMLQGGRWDRYGIGVLDARRPIGHQIDYLEGVLPLGTEPVFLPFVQVDEEVYADLHLFPDDGGDWVLLLDATPLAHRLFDMQQNTNELTLIRRELAAALAEVRRHHDDLRAILNHLDLVTAILDREGRVDFVSESAGRLLELDPARLRGCKWEEAFPLAGPDVARVRDMLTRPAERRERLAVQVVGAMGRRFAFDIDVQDDPRSPGHHLLYFYDVSQIHGLRQLLREKSQFHEFVGAGGAMADIFERIEDIAKVDATVLIQGETGTGKELAARAIHFAGPRREKPFIVVNAAGLSDSLINSQLFGHKKGAFTDAVADQEGFFEAANGGTILLDEIGDIPANTQTRILRVLEQKEIIRIGETKARKVDVRILAATNRDLEAEVRAGTFRADLFYRLRVARIQLPPLRDRREDIPLLVDAFLAQASARMGKGVDGVDHEAMRAMMDHGWPGNVRELKNAIEFAVIHAHGTVIKASDLPPEVLLPGSPSEVRRPYAVEQERERIIKAFETANGRRDEAARILGIGRATLYRRMKECLLDPADIPKRGKWAGSK